MATTATTTGHTPASADVVGLLRALRTPTVPPLDQVSDAKLLIADIEAGLVPAGEATVRLADLQSRPPRFSRAWQVIGLGLFATGFGVSVQATGQEVAASAVLGPCVGLIVVAAQTRPRLALVAPFVASVTVSTLVLFAYKNGWIDGGPIQLMVPCLFFFIPGDAISAAMLELADGRITAGATRPIYAIAVLLVLGFGALVATVIAKVPASFLFDIKVQSTLGFWAAWGGWIVFGGSRGRPPTCSTSARSTCSRRARTGCAASRAGSAAARSRASRA